MEKSPFTKIREIVDVFVEILHQQRQTLEIVEDCACEAKKNLGHIRRFVDFSFLFSFFLFFSFFFSLFHYLHCFHFIHFFHFF